MKLVKAVLRPERAVAVKDKLQDLGFHGITTTKVNGYGEMKKVSTMVYRGRTFTKRMDNVERVTLEVVVSDEKLGTAIEVMKIEGKTSEGGDGRIYTLPLDDSIHVDTGSAHFGALDEEGGGGGGGNSGKTEDI